LNRGKAVNRLSPECGYKTGNFSLILVDSKIIERPASKVINIGVVK